MRSLLLALPLLLGGAGTLTTVGAGAGTPGGVFYQGPLDAVSGATMCFSLRGCSLAYAFPANNPALQVRRNSDNQLKDILILSNGNLDVASAAAFAGPDGGTGVCTASTSGSSTTLTIASCTASATLHAGDTLTCASCVQPTYITALGTFSGTGAGASGTVTLNAAQSITSQSVTSQWGLFVRKWYDQTQGLKCASATCDFATATNANQNQLLPLCLGGGTLPCIAAVLSGSPGLGSTNSFTPTSAAATLVVVALRPSGATTQTLLRETLAGNRIVTSASANVWPLTGAASGTFTAAATDGTAHSGIAVVNGAASVFYIDNVATPGTATGNTTAGAPSMTSSTQPLYSGESIVYDNVAFSSGQVSTLHTNQSAYWGTP